MTNNSMRFYQALTVNRGMGAQVKKTVMSRKNFRPQTSESAPISGALKKDNKPCKEKEENETMQTVNKSKSKFV